MLASHGEVAYTLNSFTKNHSGTFEVKNKRRRLVMFPVIERLHAYEGLNRCFSDANMSVMFLNLFDFESSIGQSNMWVE